MTSRHERAAGRPMIDPPVAPIAALLIVDDEQVSLVVDDNPFNVKPAVHVLKSEGLDVRSVEAPQEVAPMIATWHPHLVLLDLRLPGMEA